MRHTTLTPSFHAHADRLNSMTSPDPPPPPGTDDEGDQDEQESAPDDDELVPTESFDYVSGDDVDDVDQDEDDEDD